MKNKKIEIDIEKAKELRAKGLSYAAIGKEFGVSKDTVMRRLNEASSPQTEVEKELPSVEEIDKMAQEKQSEIELAAKEKTQTIKNKLRIVGHVPDEKLQAFALEYALAYLL